MQVVPEVTARLACSRNSKRPVWLDQRGRGEVVGHESRGKEMSDYVEPYGLL